MQWNDCICIWWSLLYELAIRFSNCSKLYSQSFTFLMQVVLTSLVYEKQQNLRIMMKMHGLGDGPYWLISYAYFLAISSIYMLCFVIFGSAIGNNTTNRLLPSFVFYLRFWVALMRLFLCRVKVFHSEWLRHPVRVLFHLHKFANFPGVSSSCNLLRCKNCYRFDLHYLMKYVIGSKKNLLLSENNEEIPQSMMILLWLQLSGLYWYLDLGS